MHAAVITIEQNFLSPWPLSFKHEFVTFGHSLVLGLIICPFPETLAYSSKASVVDWV